MTVTMTVTMRISSRSSFQKQKVVREGGSGCENTQYREYREYQPPQFEILERNLENVEKRQGCKREAGLICLLLWYFAAGTYFLVYTTPPEKARPVAEQRFPPINALPNRFQALSK